MDLPDGQTVPLGDSIPVTVSWVEALAVDAITVPTGAILRVNSGHGNMAVRGLRRP